MCVSADVSWGVGVECKLYGNGVLEEVAYSVYTQQSESGSPEISHPIKCNKDDCLYSFSILFDTHWLVKLFRTVGPTSMFLPDNAVFDTSAVG